MLPDRRRILLAHQNVYVNRVSLIPVQAHGYAADNCVRNLRGSQNRVALLRSVPERLVFKHRVDLLSDEHGRSSFSGTLTLSKQPISTTFNIILATAGRRGQVAIPIAQTITIMLGSSSADLRHKDLTRPRTDFRRQARGIHKRAVRVGGSPSRNRVLEF